VAETYPKEIEIAGNQEYHFYLFFVVI
jgi:hypothetical protein